MVSTIVLVFVFSAVLVPISASVTYENNNIKVENKPLRHVTKEMFAFYDVSSLKDIRMINCQIQSLDKNTFDNMFEVTILWLQHNKLVLLPIDVFQNMLNLDYLNLNNNKLRKLENGIFANLFFLKSLYLNNNNIETVGRHVFDDLTALTGLYIGENRIKYIDGDTLRYTTSLQYLELNANNIATLEKGLFSKLTLLKRLFLHKNQLTLLNKHTFENLYALQNLSLSSNTIVRLESGIFDNTKGLEVIFLGENRIQELEDNLFSNLVSLRQLYLQRNFIKRIGVNVFPATSSLTNLNLEYNQLQFANAAEFAYLKGMQYFRLHDNPWFCDCQLKDLLEIFLKVSTDDLTPVCFRPEMLKDRAWKQLSNEELVCNDETNAQREQLQQALYSSIARPSVDGQCCCSCCQCSTDQETIKQVNDLDLRSATSSSHFFQTVPDEDSCRKEESENDEKCNIL